jgi:hypothetical protein
MKLTKAQFEALEKYGKTLALQALSMNEDDGEGSSTIAEYLSLPSVAVADALIDAGRKIAANQESAGPVLIPAPGPVKAPHAGPSRKWKATRANLDRITGYIYTPGRTAHQKALAFRLSRHCSLSLRIFNNQSWNPRNPAPFLP